MHRARQNLSTPEIRQIDEGYSPSTAVSFRTLPTGFSVIAFAVPLSQGVGTARFMRSIRGANRGRVV
jgi:hypothetical protein